MAIITEQENILLKENYQYRKKIIEEAFKDKVPDNAKDIEAINGVLNSMDKSIYDSINSRLKHQENQNKGEIISMVSETLRLMSQRQKNNQTTEQPKNVEHVDIDLNIVDGEDSIGEHKFELRDIEKGDD